MIASEGYVPISMLQNYIPPLARNVATKHWVDWAKDIHTIIFKRPDDVIKEWLMDFCHDHLFACNGLDQPIRLDSWLVREECFYVDLSHIETRRYSDAVLDISSELKSRFNFCKPISKKKYDKLYLEENPPEFDEFVQELARSHGYSQPYIFICNDLFTIDFELFDHLCSVTDKEYEYIYHTEESKRKASLLRKLDGYALCVPEKYYGENWNEYWANVAETKKKELNNISEAETNYVPKKGRPRSREDAAAHYRKLFPNGSNGISWKVVINQIKEASGERYSVSTLRRGLGQKE